MLSVVDPLMDIMGNVNTYDMSKIALILNDLKKIAENTKCAIMCVRHFTKSDKDTKNPMHLGMGSQGFMAKARSGFIVAPFGAQRAFACSKPHPLGIRQKSWIFDFEPVPVKLKNGQIVKIARINWIGQIDQTAYEIVNGTMAHMERFSIRAQLVDSIISLESEVTPGGFLLINKIVKPIPKLSEQTASGILKELGFERQTGGYGARILWNSELLKVLTKFYGLEYAEAS